MSERKAVYFGQVKLIPGINCDGYVLDDQTAVMSERGTADLLGVDQRLLNRMRTNWPPKSLETFIDKGLTMRTNLVEVVAPQSPYAGRKIVTYDSSIIETLIRSYVLAFANRQLRENQRHIGERCAILLTALVRTALDAAIKEACGFIPDIQKTAQKNYFGRCRTAQRVRFHRLDRKSPRHQERHRHLPQDSHRHPRPLPLQAPRRNPARFSGPGYAPCHRFKSQASQWLPVE